MTAYVHINLRVVDPAKQALIAPRFQAALEKAGGRIVHFDPSWIILKAMSAPVTCRDIRVQNA